MNSLEVTGNYLEVPPAKEPTSPRKKLVDLIGNRRKSSLFSVSESSKAKSETNKQHQRSLSQQSIQSAAKKKINSESVKTQQTSTATHECKNHEVCNNYYNTLF